jgi:hypothetical protein
LISIGVAAALSEGCASDPNATGSGTRATGSGNGTGNGTGAGGDTGTGAGGGNSGGNTTGTGGSGPPPINPGNPEAGADIKVTADAACAATATKGEKKQVDLLIMMDSSGSMTEMDMGQTGRRWDNLSMAIPGFVNDMANAGMMVGLDFFPEGGNQPLCSPTDYSMPNVPIAEIPGMGGAHATAIITAVQGRMPAGGTPTGPALTGAIQTARAWQMQNPTRSISVLLLTDGEPSGCDAPRNNPTGPSVMAAQAGSTGMPPIKTYVLGVGPSTGNLEAIAVAGGTMRAYMATSGGAADLSKAFADIRKSTLSCDYAIPKPEAGTADPAKLVVSARSGLTGNFVEIPNVGNSSGCTVAPGEGWYYDVPAAPTKITLCPNSCGPLQIADGSEVNILLGCEPRRIPPPN